MPLISYGKQFLDKSDISNVSKVLKSDFLTQGFEVKNFETNLKKKLKAKYCTAVSSGTALHIRSVIWKKNDVVILP